VTQIGLRVTNYALRILSVVVLLCSPRNA